MVKFVKLAILKFTSKGEMIMLVDYHVHIERGPYSLAWLDKFIKTAQANNIEEIGIVEHSHCFKEFAFLYDEVIQDQTEMGFYQKNWLKRRLGSISIDEYVDFIEEAQNREYPIKMGLEICYFPGCEKKIRKIIEQFEFDFIIGSIHWIKGWGFDHPATKSEWNRREINEIYQIYNQLLIDVIQSQLFDIIAHIDSIKAFSSLKRSWVSDKVIQALAKNNLCLEVNTGIKHRRLFEHICPDQEILNRCFQNNIPIIISSDAHQPTDVGRLIDEAVKLCKKAGYQEISIFNKRIRSNVILC